MGWDGVVVGAGHNGLVAANLLADAGWSVLVLEANAAPGGGTRTAELAAPGFRSELCSAFYPLTAASPVIAALGLDRYGLRWRHHGVPLVHVLPDGRTVTLSRDPAETAASVERFAAGDGERWLAEFAAWGRMKDALLGSLLGPFPPVRSGIGLARRLGPAELLRFARFAVQSTRAYGRERFRGEGARLLVTGNAMHADLTLDTSGGAVIGWLLSMLAQDVGFPVAEGGGQSITDALVHRLEERGGEVRCGARVTAVEVRDGAAVGVRTVDGQAHPAAGAVLADVSAPALYRDLVGLARLPARVAADLAGFRWDGATVKVDWALSGPVPWTDEAVRRAGTVHLDLDLDGFGRFALDLAGGRVPEQPFVLAGQMTSADPSRSPAGTETLWAYTHVPRGLQPDRRGRGRRPGPGDDRAARARLRRPGGRARGQLAGRAAGGEREPRRRRGRRRHGGAVPAAGVPADSRARPGRHADRPALPGVGLGPPGRRRARRLRVERGPSRAGP